MEFAGQQHGSFHQPGAQVAGSNCNTSRSHTPHGDGDYSLLDEDRFSLFSSFSSPYSAAPAAALASPWAREFLNVGNCGSTCSEGAYTSPPASSRSSSVGDLNDAATNMAEMMHKLDLCATAHRSPFNCGPCQHSDVPGGSASFFSEGAYATQPSSAQQHMSYAPVTRHHPQPQHHHSVGPQHAGSFGAATAADPHYHSHVTQPTRHLQQQQQQAHFRDGGDYLSPEKPDGYGGRYRPEAAVAAADARTAELAAELRHRDYLAHASIPGHHHLSGAGLAAAAQQPLHARAAAAAAAADASDARRACEGAVVREAALILRDAGARSLRAVELANALRARLGTDALARARELHGGLLSLLERHPRVFRVDRIPKSDCVTLVAMPAPEYYGLFSAAAAAAVAPRRAPAGLEHMRAEAAAAAAQVHARRRSFAEPLHEPQQPMQQAPPQQHQAHPAQCVRQQQQLAPPPHALAPRVETFAGGSGSSSGSSAPPPPSSALVTLTSDRFVPTQSWPVSPREDWPYVACVSDVLRAAGGSTTISKLRGLLRARLGSAATIKSVPLKAMLVAYAPLFALCGNRVALLPPSAAALRGGGALR